MNANHDARAQLAPYSAVTATQQSLFVYQALICLRTRTGFETSSVHVVLPCGLLA